MDTIILITIVNIVCFSLGYYFCFVALEHGKKKDEQEEVVFYNDEVIEDEEAFVPERD